MPQDFILVRKSHVLNTHTGIYGRTHIDVVVLVCDWHWVPGIGSHSDRLYFCSCLDPTIRAARARELLRTHHTLVKDSPSLSRGGLGGGCGFFI